WWCLSPWVRRLSASSACAQPAGTKGSYMPNAKKKKGYSANDLREVSDNPEWTRKDFAKARPFAEALPELAASIRKGRGPNKAPTKKLVSLRLSGKVLEAYKAKGRNWQSRIDEDLRRINKIK
ncbi:BrnA antitoxin family protein, partial [Bradyrhizobium sp.]|uniref:BrnA antitoxin family protein n=1 Tax=Bradyrhizobium sp. TaxID=376 RepID=UPI0034465929